MKRNLDLELHVWKEVLSLLKYDYNKTDDYHKKEDLTQQIEEAKCKVKDLQEEYKEKVS